MSWIDIFPILHQHLSSFLKEDETPGFPCADYFPTLQILYSTTGGDPFVTTKRPAPTNTPASRPFKLSSPVYSGSQLSKYPNSFTSRHNTNSPRNQHAYLPSNTSAAAKFKPSTDQLTAAAPVRGDRLALPLQNSANGRRDIDITPILERDVPSRLVLPDRPHIQPDPLIARVRVDVVRAVDELSVDDGLEAGFGDEGAASERLMDQKRGSVFRPG